MTLARRSEPARVRAALVATTPVELTARLQTLVGWLDDGRPDAVRIEGRAGVFLGANTGAPRLGFLFPGQGAPVYSDAGALGHRFPWLQNAYKAAELGSSAGPATEVAQPAIVLATLTGLDVLNRLGLQAAVAVGHSLGELCALYWAGALDAGALLRIAQARGRLMADRGDPNGAMLHLGAAIDQVVNLINGGSPLGAATVACLNAPRQVVVSGAAPAIAELMSKAKAAGWRAGLLPVSHAFHSPLMAAAVTPFADYLSGEVFRPLGRPVVSTVTSELLPGDIDVPGLLAQQVTSPVRFSEALTQAAQQVDLLIEVGPGRMLSGLAAECTAKPVISLDAGGPSLQGLLRVAGAAYVLGAPLNRAVLFDDRFTRSFDLNRPFQFFTNPCELAPILDICAPAPDLPAWRESDGADSLPADSPAPDSDRNPAIAGDTAQTLEMVRRLVAERAELPVAAVRAEDRLLSDLHLNSITVSQLVAEAARQMNLAPPLAPTEYANVTVAAVAETLNELARTGGARPHEQDLHRAPGIASWVRAFTVELVERSLVRRSRLSESDAGAAGDWRIATPPGHPLALPLQAGFAGAPGSGMVVCLPSQADAGCLDHLLGAIHSLLERSTPDERADRCFVLVQQGAGAAAVARTLHLEQPAIRVRVVNLPFDHPEAAAWVVAEAMAGKGGYCEAHYDDQGRRREPVLRLLSLSEAGKGSSLPLGSDDVLLVTGGAKGITAECALALAREAGARLALIGRSDPETDPELAANLARFRAAGVQFRYFVADITQPDAVCTTVTQVQQAFGPITGIVHGAARNVPQRLSALDSAAFRATLAPKIQGAQNLLDAVDPKRLRLFLTFGSIIARTGLSGEADYGLANQWLVDLTERFQIAHPACRCLAVEWSVWAGVGMGDRLGVLETLARQGIQPVPLESGIDMLRRLIAHIGLHTAATRPVAVVVAGRIGAPPTLALEARELPFLRFLEETQVYYPGVELVVDATLSVDSDPYLDDHIVQGERLLPAVMGLEAMAQAAIAVADPAQSQTFTPVFSEVHFARPVVIPAGAPLTIRLAALVRAPGQIEVALRSAETAFQVDHFRGLPCCSCNRRYGIRYGWRNLQRSAVCRARSRSIASRT